MKSGRWASTKALCPYYKEQDYQRIICAGFLPNSCVHLTFGNAIDRKAYEQLFCETNYKACPIYKMEEGADAYDPD